MLNSPAISPASPALVARCRDRTRHFAAVIVAAECERRHIDRGQVHVEMVEIVVSTITSFLAACQRRFPRLTSNLSGRFATDRLPTTMVRRMRTTVVQAVAKRLDPAVAALAAPQQQQRQIGEVAPLHGPMFILSGTREETARAAQAAGFADVRAWVAALLRSHA